MADHIRFELQLPQGNLFKDVLEALSDLFSRAYFDFSLTGLKLQTLDTCSVALVELFLHSEGFMHYRCNHRLSVGLNLTDMAKVFRCANKDDTITMKSEHDFADVVTCTFKSLENGNISEYDFNFMGTNPLPISIPESWESDYKARIRMPSAMFVDICNKLISFDDSEDTDTVVVITVDGEGAMFFTGGKTGNSSVVCSQTQIVGKPKTIELKEERVSVTLDLRRMNSFSKASVLSDEVTISLSPQLVVFEYKISEMSYIKYYLPAKTIKDEMQNEGEQNVGEEMQGDPEVMTIAV